MAVNEKKISALSAAELLGLTSREFILMVGKDGAGKSCALVSLAWWVQYVLNPGATFFIIDTENKFPTALRSFGTDGPTNIQYYKCDTMNMANEAMWDIQAKRKAGDWLAVESMGRMWEKAQDMGYMATSGYDKASYLDKRREAKTTGKGQAAVIPSPDNFWNVVKGAHDGEFLDLIAEAGSLNVVLTSTISKPRSDKGNIKENETRKEIRVEFGLDLGIDGAPRLPTYPETTLMLDLNGGKVTCRVLRDNLSNKENTRPTFAVDDRKSWAPNFWATCRNLGG